MPTRSRYPSLDRKPGKSNWVDQQGGLPPYIDRIARRLHHEKGMSISRAIATAVSTVRRWARGGDNVKPDTRAKAARAVAQWEAMKARTKTDLAEQVDLAFADRKPPYDYKHGWIPISPQAKALDKNRSKLKGGSGSGRGRGPSALAKYTSNSFEINAKLRKGETHADVDEIDAEFKPNPKKTTVRRVVSNEAKYALLNEFKKDKPSPVEDKGYMSTQKASYGSIEDQVEDFAPGVPRGRVAILEFDIPKDHPTIDVGTPEDGLGYDQGEMLLPRGTKLLPTGMERRGKYDVVKAKIVATRNRSTDLSELMELRRRVLMIEDPGLRKKASARVLDLAYGDRKPPYDYKHGWIPITPLAKAVVAGKIKPKQARSGNLPKGMSDYLGDERIRNAAKTGTGKPKTAPKTAPKTSAKPTPEDDAAARKAARDAKMKAMREKILADPEMQERARRDEEEREKQAEYKRKVEEYLEQLAKEKAGKVENRPEVREGFDRLLKDIRSGEFDGLSTGGRWTPRGDTPRDEILAKMWSKNGFDGKPQQVSDEQFDGTPGPVMYRGVMGVPGKTAEQMRDEFYDGIPPWVGAGFAGNGTYFSTAKEIAEQFGGTESESLTFVAKLSPDAKRISANEAENISLAWVDRANAATDITETERARLIKIGSDLGRVATYMGYDYIDNGDSYLQEQVVLNRTKVIVKRNR